MEHDLDQVLQFSPDEQIRFEKEQNLYSLIKTIEYLEWAYMCGKIKGTEYDAEFRQLLHFYQMCQDSIQNFEGIDKFCQRYDLTHCHTAKQRIKEKRSGYKGEEAEAGLAVRVMDITQKMIGILDLIEL